MNLALSTVPKLIRERDVREPSFVVRKSDGQIGQVLDQAFDGWLYVIWDHPAWDRTWQTSFINPNAVIWIRPASHRRRKAIG
ncbi:MAG TPA: hypothetical protein VFU31_21195 [Candidatus Binatia bacterium]|nr:hypothetical protein [Candidatus Binatia bacterium]